MKLICLKIEMCLNRPHPKAERFRLFSSGQFKKTISFYQ